MDSFRRVTRAPAAEVSIRAASSDARVESMVIMLRRTWRRPATDLLWRVDNDLASTNAIATPTMMAMAMTNRKSCIALVRHSFALSRRMRW